MGMGPGWGRGRCANGRGGGLEARSVAMRGSVNGMTGEIGRER